MNTLVSHFPDLDVTMSGLRRERKSILNWNIFLWLGIALCLVIVSRGLFSQALNQKEVTPKLDTYIQKVIQRLDIPGVAAAVTYKGKMVYAGAFGLRNLNTKEPLRPDHIFHMASVSKPFVATAIMQLVEQGKIKLDERLVKYLPYFKLVDQRYKTITIRQMLNHTSGMPDVIDYEWDKPQYDDGAAERYVRSLSNEKMIAAPGERWQYSNMAFDVLGDVIAKVSGKPFEVYVKENILDPLGMKESNFLRKAIREDLRTMPHIWRVKPIVSQIYPYNRPHAPSSTLNSSVVEMVNWILVNLNRGELNGKRILKGESYDVLWKPSVKITEKIEQGLSWFLSTRYRDIFTISHAGGDRGYASYIALLPEKKIGLIIASNYEKTPTEAIMVGILDILLGYQPEMPKKRIDLEFGAVYEKEGIEAARNRYFKLLKESKEEFTFNVQELNRLGYYYLREKQVEKAIEVFTFNVELYPDVGNTYDSLGEAYMTAGSKEKAIQNYEKAVQLDPTNTNAAEILKKLKK